MAKLLALFAAILVAASCAHPGAISTADRLALYRAHAGPPVGGFRLDRFNRIFRWTPLGDEAVAVWTSAGRGQLLEFRSRCSGLGTASSITITNQMGWVNARLDSVQPRTAGGVTSWRMCRIHSIRPLDSRTLSDAKRELREANLAERAADVTPED